VLAEFLEIATQGLVNTKHGGSQILLHAYLSQRGIGAGFHCLTGKAIATQQREAILVNLPPVHYMGSSKVILVFHSPWWQEDEKTGKKFGGTVISDNTYKTIYYPTEENKKG
jgi:hypothetical protein